MEIKILGLENDCIYNANERMVLRVHLRSILAEDLNDDTLYSKVLAQNNTYFLSCDTHTCISIYIFMHNFYTCRF